MRGPYELVRARPEPEFEISVDGAGVPVVPGQTIGAAMHGAGIRSWRTTRFGGRPRGLFCGIGVCFDCLVTVNGVPSLRACLTEARPEDRVTTGTDATVGTDATDVTDGTDDAAAGDEGESEEGGTVGGP
ncbi:(2Fe-2S)-binding protein [Streptosporangium sp. NPDC023615]|uniref:(2Fe-2S)-binding protein n=1 Tax=Streptosporangium sp. NPDC023615 TaxID=3154794 RepID=UPI0034405800